MKDETKQLMKQVDGICFDKFLNDENETVFNKTLCVLISYVGVFGNRIKLSNCDDFELKGIKFNKSEYIDIIRNNGTKSKIIGFCVVENISPSTWMFILDDNDIHNNIILTDEQCQDILKIFLKHGKKKNISKSH